MVTMFINPVFTVMLQLFTKKSPKTWGYYANSAGVVHAVAKREAEAEPEAEADAQYYNWNQGYNGYYPMTYGYNRWNNGYSGYGYNRYNNYNSYNRYNFYNRNFWGNRRYVREAKLIPKLMLTTTTLDSMETTVPEAMDIMNNTNPQ